MKIKSKLILIIILMIGFILLIGTMSKVIAADVTTVSTNTNGYGRDVDVEVTMATEDGKTYKYAVLKDDTSEPTEADWKPIYFSSGKATVTIDDENLLKEVDKAYLWLAEVENDVQTTIHEKDEVDLPLPDITLRFEATGFLATTIKIKPVYGITSGKYQFVRITDTTLVNLLKDYYDSEDNTEKLQIMEQIVAKMPEESSAPTSGWSNFTTDNYLTPPTLGANETEGYFYLWMNTEGTGIRKIVGVNPIKIYNTTSNNNDDDDNNNAANTNSNKNTANGVTTITDNTTAKKDLPATGKDMLGIVLVAIVVCGLVGYIKYKKIDIK
jgi:hypothetical protein